MFCNFVSIAYKYQKLSKMRNISENVYHYLSQTSYNKQQSMPQLQYLCDAIMFDFVTR